jgi:transposase
VRGAETVPRNSRGYDAGKRANGRKRHIVTDTCGWLLAALVTGAQIQDRDADHLLMWIIRTVFPTIRLVWADGGYAGKLTDYAAGVLGITVQVVSKLAGQVGFVVLPAGGPSSARFVDQPLPPHRPRLQTAARTPRRDRLLVNDHHHGTPPGSPARRRPSHSTTDTCTLNPLFTRL